MYSAIDLYCKMRLRSRESDWQIGTSDAYPIKAHDYRNHLSSIKVLYNRKYGLRKTRYRIQVSSNARPA